MADDGINRIVDAVAESRRNEQADAGRDGLTCTTRLNCQAQRTSTTGGVKYVSLFSRPPLGLATFTFTRLIHTLLYVKTT